MEHIAALLLVIGCSNSMTDCRELQVPVSIFENADECTAERPFAMGDVQGQAQHIVARCLAVDPALEDDYDQVVWKVLPDGSLDASLAISSLVMASNAARPEKDYLSQE
ncbi:hypothetical protein EFV37_07375 [Mesorhizobium loti]|uniref:Uncharacterized protein n=1 Tax=Mesorhizobium jarvisii TaxID=1777867 RepID=A0A6M7TAT4_9HYPH|nr:MULTISPECIES: hypothetical protein [Mesorhizobium]OBQ76485.1 hypothetical protein A9K72_05565 [Mesorhizobium loti]QKC62144.1 hypothetical protein EB229_07370 [Mesorhizobium jarvisii]QKD08055.1 hypothetical protein EFV37_07375 [Mesorhizobium loti]RJT35831.1 hypothetical protein D3242_10350 [Mesorhizobium jarvisii]BCG99526.1 hypothetical protein MesoLj131b_15260 [Mesorhizobium sp. 131-2-5]